MLGKTFETRAVDPTGRGERAILVEPQAGAPDTPVVDRAVARSGVEGEQRIAAADPGDVRDAADIHQRDRLRQIVGESRVIYGHQRRTLPARRHVGTAQIVHYLHAECLGEGGAVADLPGEALLR